MNKLMESWIYGSFYWKLPTRGSEISWVFHTGAASNQRKCQY